jgi:dipeptidyl aminopeptidase/acylaminoacyl peptidase
MTASLRRSASPLLVLLLPACASAPTSPGVVPAAPAALESHPFGVDDMLAMDRIGDAQLSPDGSLVLFTLRTTDMAANRGRTDLWVVAADGGEPRRLTSDPGADVNGRWLPDGRGIVFLSSRSGSLQVWELSLAGGKPRQRTDLPVDVTNLAVFPDGRRLALTMDVYPGSDPAATAARDAERAASPVSGLVFDSLLFRHWDTWEDGKRSHLFVWSEEDGARDLMPAMDADTPTRPFGGAEEIAVSPDGREVAFAAKDDGRVNAWTTNVDVWLVPADGSAAPRRVSTSRGMDNGPAWSPDGRTLAWLSMERAGYESDRQRIVLMDRHSGETRILAEDWDRSASEIVWAPDSRRIYTSADNVGNHSLFAIEVPSGQVGMMAEKGTNRGPMPAGDRVLFLHDDLRSPVEIVAAQKGGAGWQPVTRINARKVAAARMGDHEQFSFTGAHGDTVYGFLVKPVDFDPSRKYPVAFLIHGGPQGSFGDHFHYRWNPQAYAGAGYAAVMIDFHGSTGYGQAFTDAIRGDWGGAPFEDLMKGLDHALERYAFLDRDRIGALGASYGGYMINWVAGHTDRFRCLVNHDGNLDERMAYFDTEELWFPEWDHGGTPWENPEGFARHNPIDHVANWKTPMLVIHGALDYRVVDTQGMSTFTVLQRRGIPSRFLYFPDENHWVLKPHNSRFWHQTVIGWLDQWVRPSTNGS